MLCEAGASKRPAASDKAAPPAKRGKKAAEASAEEEAGPSDPSAVDPTPQEPAPLPLKDAKEYPELPEDRMIACAMLQVSSMASLLSRQSIGNNAKVVVG